MIICGVIARKRGAGIKKPCILTEIHVLNLILKLVFDPVHLAPQKKSRINEKSTNFTF